MSGDRVLVTGGSGFLGINLIRFLRQRDYQITSLDLVEFDHPDLLEQVRAIAGDIRDIDTVRRAMDGVRWVVHAAAALPLYTRDDIFTTDIDGTRNVLDAALEAGVERVVQISSTAVYGIPDHHPLLEDDPLVGVGPYGEAKVQAEAVCLQYRAKGLCVPILRPKSFVGPERLGVFALLYDWAQSGHGFPVLGAGTNRYQLLDVEDLCEAIHLAVTLDAERVNETFNIGAREFGTIREDYQAVLDRAGFGRRVVSLPARPAVWTLRMLERLKLSPLYRWVYETACEDSFISIEKAQRVLGFDPRYSNRDALLRNFEWYLANRARFEGQSGISHRAPWKQGILRVAKRLF
jgi:nucleoside-diphosphate-sugar epimerase